MLLSVLLSNGTLADKMLAILVALIALLPALTVHEWAHGFAAYKLGDSTAKADGRLSLNPLDHLDPIGSLMLLLVGFGWAKPVPVMTRNFKKPKRDFAITAFAGPFANLVMGLISAMLFVLCHYCSVKFGFSGIYATIISRIFLYSLLYNIGLGLFNLIPIPPLDGSNILMCLLPNRLAMKYAQIRYYTRYIFIALIILSRMPYPLGAIYDIVFFPLNFLRDFLTDGFVWIFDVIFSRIFF